MVKEYNKAVYLQCAYNLHACNLHAVYLKGNVGLDKSQAGINIAMRNINSLRYANDTNLMAESEEEVQSHLLRMKEENEKAG